MSAESWMAEYYPKPANEATGSALEAAEHSLRKWIGLRRENRERHELIMDADRCVVIPAVKPKRKPGLFRIDSSSCALCCRCRPKKKVLLDCAVCPLYISRGGVACDVAKIEVNAGKEMVSPFRAFALNGDPEPMIRDLERTVEMLRSAK